MQIMSDNSPDLETGMRLINMSYHHFSTSLQKKKSNAGMEANIVESVHSIREKRISLALVGPFTISFTNRPGRLTLQEKMRISFLVHIL